MQGKVKLTKRQVKEDKFTTFMLTSKDRFLENWQFYVGGLVVVVLAISFMSWYVNHSSDLEIQAAEKFAAASMSYSQDEYQIARLGFSEILDDYAGTAVTSQATFLLGNICLDAREYDEAQRYFEMYVNKYKDDKLSRASALAGIATVHENQAKYADAATYFVRASKEWHDGPLAGEYELGAVRNFVKAENVESARERLEVLKADFEGNMVVDQAIRLMSEKGHI